MEEFFKIELTKELSNNLLEKLLLKFDHNFYPINSNLNNPSEQKIIYQGEVYLSGRTENENQNAQIIKYAAKQPINYFHVKGAKATDLILDLLKEEGISYSTPMAKY